MTEQITEQLPANITPFPSCEKEFFDTLTFDNREDWLEERKLHITASECAQVYCVSPKSWGSRWSLWNEKMGGESTFDDSMAEIMAFATEDEELIERRFVKRHPHRLVSDPGPFTLQVSKVHPWMAATVDRFQKDPDKGLGILEFKSVMGFKGHEWDNDGIPIHYMFQCQHQMMVTGCDWGTLAVRIGSQYHEVEFKRNQKFCEHLASDVQGGIYDFHHNNVLGLDNLDDDGFPTPHAPDVDGYEATTKAMIDYFGVHPVEDTVALPPDIASLDTEWLEVYALEKKVKERKRHIQNQVRELLGSSKRGEFDGIVYGIVYIKEAVVKEHTRKASNYIKRLKGPKREEKEEGEE